MRKPFCAVIFVLLLFIPTVGISGTITTPQIIARTTSAAVSCMRWIPVGLCFWLRCSFSAYSG